MIDRIPKKHHRALALTILAFVILGALSVTAAPLWGLNHEYDARIETLRDQLATLQETASADKRLKPRLEAIKIAQRDEGHFLKGNTATVAAAELQGLVKRLANANATEVLSAQTLPATEEEGLKRVALQVRLRGTYESLIRSLYAFETSPTFFFIENASLHDVARRGDRYSNDNTWMEADLDLAAYMMESIDEG